MSEQPDKQTEAPELATPEPIEWGPATIDFLYSRKGAVWFDIKTKGSTIQVYITKSGKIRFFDAQRREIFREGTGANKEENKKQTLISEGEQI